MMVTTDGVSLLSVTPDAYDDDDDGHSRAMRRGPSWESGMVGQSCGELPGSMVRSMEGG